MNDYYDTPYHHDPYQHEPKRRGSGLRFISMLIAVILIAGGTTYCVQDAMNSKLEAQLESRLELLEQKIQANVTAAPAAQNTVLTPLPITAASGALSISDIAEAVRPSIVGLRILGQTRARFGLSPEDNTLSEGSGVIMSQDGYIMTNYHVIEYSKTQNASIKVILSDGRDFDATLVGGDPATDLAVVKIDASGLPAAAMGSSSSLRVGDTAIAIGNPMGLEFAGSVTSGIISAIDRTIDIGDITLSVIQTDAAINPGNSGGALLNERGEVIGINTVKISSTGVEGLGFAIPIDDALPILGDLRQYGKVTGRPSIGISGVQIDKYSSRMYGYPIGFFIEEVSVGSGADRAGVKSGDIITVFGGHQISSSNDINEAKSNYKVGDIVSVTLMRYNESTLDYDALEVNITLGEA